MRFASFIAAMTLLNPSIGHAQDEGRDPIDYRLKSCIDASAQTTAAMAACTANAIKEWDTKLNKIYQDAIAAIDPESAALLRTAQRRWVAFRESEHAVQAAPWRNNRGTIITLDLLENNLSAIRERVKELQTYVGDGD